ncbi:MAG: 2,3-bisphosphoglycerate-independent phosphoglycerate mutase [Oscillospiraceae bacterium]|nr:2,3-bisphosphoglycerate-independent phosphoglycerate mutase [Oscillospiraceae bacterium]
MATQAQNTENRSIFDGQNRPILTIVMDGVGYTERTAGNAVRAAYTPTLDLLETSYPRFLLQAHGTAVGLPSDDDMGNSEVGHNALGAGQVFAQGAKLVNSAIESGRIYQSDAWKALTARVKETKGTLHFLGLFSDGNVHSHVEHLRAMVKQAKAEGVSRVRIHILLDGRDVGETSALEYVTPFEEFLAGLRDGTFDVCIASGGGRMQITMDRYEANWGMVEKGWHTHVLGEGRTFASATEAIQTLRAETSAIDQDLPPFVIAKDGKPVGTVEDGDAVIFFNFRGDRSIEISRAFEGGKDFDRFDRVRVPDVLYAGMVEYDGDAHIPSRYLVSPPEITGTMGEFLVQHGVKQLALSETQKFGHVTYFWNGNRSGKFSEELEEYIEIPSDIVPFEQRPWMKCAEITDVLIEKLRSGEFGYLRVNFPNGDMVGHTGSFVATRISMEALDLCLARILKVVDEVGGIAIITADHGNADEMYEIDKKTGEPKYSSDGVPKAKTSHTLNPVPCYIYDNFYRDNYECVEGKYGLANIAATVATMMGLEPPAYWKESMIRVK